MLTDKEVEKLLRAKRKQNEAKRKARNEIAAYMSNNALARDTKQATRDALRMLKAY